MISVKRACMSFMLCLPQVRFAGVIILEILATCVSSLWTGTLHILRATWHTVRVARPEPQAWVAFK